MENHISVHLLVYEKLEYMFVCCVLMEILERGSQRNTQYNQINS
jgi:hypothetical protein